MTSFDYLQQLIQSTSSPKKFTNLFHFSHVFFPQPFQAQLAATTDPDKKQMLERLDTAVTAALQPLKAASDGGAAEDVVQPQVRIQRLFTGGRIVRTICLGFFDRLLSTILFFFSLPMTFRETVTLNTNTHQTGTTYQ